eukprot:GHRR01003925.1.p2 GENE.GHRR01003925.1~~GHRR01003925.1.p2  ORF type:complete len:173 (+),score=70.33 GHRR01003925.1:935-1453(+)
MLGTILLVCAQHSWLHGLNSLFLLHTSNYLCKDPLAGQGGPVPEVTAAFLQSPDQAREAIQLAVRLYHQRATAPIPLSSMDRNAAPAAANSSAALAGTLRQRLQSLNQLVAREVLSKSEADGLKVAVLAAVNDPTARLGEAADLVDQGLITHAEFALLKANIVRQLKDDARP